MSASWPRRFTQRAAGALRQLAVRSRAAILANPTLAPWFVADGATQSQRASNRSTFGLLLPHERMLADRSRVDFYHAAIERHVQPGDRVIDLGTGTGILAAFASRRGAAKVYALDHADVITHARSVAAANGIRNVEFVETHSTAFSAPEPVDVIVHEQMGTYLFEEEMVANVTDLRDRMLKPGGTIIPACFDFFCEPIQIRDGRAVPFLWELDVHGYDFSSLRDVEPSGRDYFYLVASEPDFVERFLGSPEPAFSFDLHTVAESAMPREIHMMRTVVEPGRLDGLAVYFRTRVDDDLVLTTDPKSHERGVSWGFWVLRTPREAFGAGDEIEIRLTVGRWSEVDTWRWSCRKTSR